MADKNASGSKQQDNRAASLLNSYEKTVFWSRMALAAFFVIYVATLLWTLPWIPYGLDASDYDSHTAFLVFLLFSGSGAAFAATYLRDHRRHTELALSTWTTVHDGLSDLRRREYFYDRIVIECERAREQDSQFVVVVLNLGQDVNPPDVAQLHKALDALEPMVKEFDCVASISPHEIGVLAPLVTQADAEEFAHRLRELSAAALGLSADNPVHVACAIFGHDATEAGELVGIARSRTLARAS